MNVAIIAAAGQGTRMGGKRAKQFLELAGIPIIIHTLKRFEQCDVIQEIIVVFDGGEFGHASREVRSGIVIIFAGQKSNADNWILNYVEKHNGQDILLVTLDRKLTEECERFQTQSIDVFEFYNIVKNCLLENVEPQTSDRSELQIYDDSQTLEELQTGIDRKALALLMQQASFQSVLF